MGNLLNTILERVVIGIVGMIGVIMLKVFQLNLSKYMVLWKISTIDSATIFSNLFNWSAFLITLPLMTLIFYFIDREPPNFTTDSPQFSNRVQGAASAMSHFVTVGLLWVIVAALFSEMDKDLRVVLTTMF
jgi:hypothetical protein